MDLEILDDLETMRNPGTLGNLENDRELGVIYESRNFRESMDLEILVNLETMRNLGTPENLEKLETQRFWRI